MANMIDNSIHIAFCPWQHTVDTSETETETEHSIYISHCDGCLLSLKLKSHGNLVAE